MRCHPLAVQAGTTLAYLAPQRRSGEFERSFDVKLRGAVHGSRALLPHLLTRPEVALVNTCRAPPASPPRRCRAPYIAGEFALRGFTDALRRELLAPNVHVMCVHPGVVKINLGANAPPAARWSARPTAGAHHADGGAPAARKILGGIERRKARLMIGADGKLMDLLGRYALNRYPQLTYPVLRGGAAHRRRHQ